MDIKIVHDHTQFCRNVIQSVSPVHKSSSVLHDPVIRTAIIATAIFFTAHFALLIGVTTPEKFYFDEVHYVPAARQMLLPVMPSPMLNPMHPPLAKQLIALSIEAFGDNPLGWRYAGVLFGALAVVAVYLCGLALFAAQGPAFAASRPASTASRIARAIATGSRAPAMAVFISTPSQPSSIAMAASEAVPTPASTITGTETVSRMILML